MIEIVTKVLPAILSWPVAAMVIAMLLRKSLVRLLDSAAHKLKKITLSGVEVEFVDTALGNINQSRTAVDFPVNNFAFENKNLGFRISFPVKSQVPDLDFDYNADNNAIVELNREYKFASDEVARSTYLLLRWANPKLPLAFRQNINVMVTPLKITIIDSSYIIKQTTINKKTFDIEAIISIISIDKYNAQKIGVLLNNNAKNVSINIDKKNNSGVYEVDLKHELEVVNEPANKYVKNEPVKEYLDLHHVSRDILSNGFAYVSTPLASFLAAPILRRAAYRRACA